MGDGSPPIGGGLGPHQMVGAHAAQVGSAFYSWVVGPHQLVGASGVASMRQEGKLPPLELPD